MQTKLQLPDVQAYKGLRGPSRVISYIFHPVFMPTIMAILVSYLNRAAFAALDMPHRLQLLGNIALNTILFPILTTLLLKALGFIDSIQMHKSKDRIIPLIATMIFYFWAYLIMKNVQAPLSLRVLMLGAFWGVIAVFIINIFVKISMHTAAAGGVLGIVLVVMMISHINLFLPLLLALLIGGIIGTARMVLQAHKPSEVWLGYLVGVLVQVAAYWYLK
ncbi:hypothetical protein [Taibaiella helva]|uniref:hypothetical protein n=1 Tax=Taibaiella helva TaxID=2301235 RepID=UPI000E576DF2|nr:hypothetical protein [Taibaiella helva]